MWDARTFSVRSPSRSMIRPSQVPRSAIITPAKQGRRSQQHWSATVVHGRMVVPTIEEQYAAQNSNYAIGTCSHERL